MQRFIKYSILILLFGISAQLEAQEVYVNDLALSPIHLKEAKDLEVEFTLPNRFQSLSFSGAYSPMNYLSVSGGLVHIKKRSTAWPSINGHIFNLSVGAYYPFYNNKGIYDKEDENYVLLSFSSGFNIAQINSVLNEFNSSISYNKFNSNIGVSISKKSYRVDFNLGYNRANYQNGYIRNGHGWSNSFDVFSRLEEVKYFNSLEIGMKIYYKLKFAKLFFGGGNEVTIGEDSYSKLDIQALYVGANFELYHFWKKPKRTKRKVEKFKNSTDEIITF